jgi:pimeloyl-ACP methyl ester carboxylesterase
VTAALPVVLVPGLMCTEGLYAPQLPALVERSYVLVADTTRDDSIAGFAERILRDAPPRFALAGLSMGGYIAFEVLRRAPERVAKLALLDTSARPDAPEATARRKRQSALALAGGYAEVIEELFPMFVATPDDTALHEAFAAMAWEIGPETFVRQQRAIATRPDSRPSLAAIAVPTLVLVGEHDRATPPALSDEIAAGIAHATLETIPASGHLTTLERPAEVTRIVLGWLAA